MVYRFFKYIHGELGLLSLITAGLVVMGLYLDNTLKNKLDPINTEMITGFHSVEKNFDLMNEKFIKIHAQNEALSGEISKTMTYQQTLRVEVKENDQLKVSKEMFWHAISDIKNDFWKQIQEMNARMNTFEIGRHLKKEEGKNTP